MTILWMTLAIVFLFGYFARYASATVITHGYSHVIRPSKLFVLGSMITLVTVAGLRSNIGDTFNYVNIYEENTFTWEYVLSQKDIGFGILQMILKAISEDPQIMIFTTALFTNALIVIILAIYSKRIELSLYVYITGGLFLVSMNGIRQALAGAIAFTATKYLIEGNFIKYSLIVVLASFIHQSALILLPIYFVVRFKPWSKATIALLILSIFIVMGYGKFSSILFSAIEDTQYGGYEDFNEGGASKLRVLVMAAPLIIAYLGRDKLKRLFPKSDVIVNMTLLSVVFMIVSTQSWIFARFTIYFGLYQLILISWIVDLFKLRDQKVIYYGILVCYLAYYYYESVISLNIIYKSNFLTW
ncbi:EpsG family protein [Pseudalkalibacillus hwajinpoensis]|uniref:EpsG family protein n=1 Tax=Guptibacillus hwajinpoensis TaxID=208199 RepID=UPI001CFECA3D|nr:EpsG family protein [Pseudalkalibacillus hwajinpoensis]